jgi:SNF2 family DNA or RNA helicase
MPHPKRRDWFMLPSPLAKEIAATPGLQLDKHYGLIAHLSHLPLLKAHAEVEPFLHRTTTPDETIAHKRAAFDATTEPNGWKLREYQHIGREFIQKRRGTLLADGLRVGKTAQCISAHEPAAGPMLVVAPLQTREVWLAWFKRRWPNIRPVVLNGLKLNQVDPKRPVKPKQDRGFDILDGDRFDRALLKSAQLVFCNYAILGAWKDFGHRRIGTLVLDEIHLVSQRASRRAQAVTFVANLAEQVIAATGTPIWNKPAGLFTTLSCVAPSAFASFFEYAMRFCDAHPGPHGYIYDGVSNELEFKARLSEIMLRRTWQDVSGQLPAIERAVEVVPITAKQQFNVEKEYEQVRDHRQRSTAIGVMARFRRLLAKIKIGAAVDVAGRILAGGEKVVVWTWHKDIARDIESHLEELGHPGFVVSGSLQQNLREDILNRWRTHPAPAPLVLTLSVGQVGIDLSAARQCVFAELDFTPSVVAQAEMRTFAPTRPMAATYIVIDHEIERRILAALQDKCEVAYRMGVPAAESTIGVLASAFARATDGPDDFEALARAIMMSHPEIDEDDDYHGALWDYDFEKGDTE